jgi:8-oxo-dGTP diphosphatase
MERPKVGVGVIIVKDGKVLMQKRKNAHGDGCWNFSGGHLEFNESWEDCAKRETFEEFGITVKNISFVSVTNDFFPKENKHYISIFMKAEIDSGEPQIKEPDKTESIDWFSWDNMPEPLFEPIVNLMKTNFSPFSLKYQHYKRGGLYEIVGEGRHSETLEKLVVYRALYESELGKNVIWVRPKDEFHDKVIVDGKEVPRFLVVDD